MKIKPRPAADIAGEIMSAAAKTLVLDQGHPTVDAKAISDVTSRLCAALTDDRRSCVTWYRSNIALLFKTLGCDEGTCRSCGKKIWWVVTKAGKKAPFTEDGLNHFGDCKTADEHRRTA